MSHLKRLHRDMLELSKDPLDESGVYFWFSEDDISEVYVMLVGPKDTPYLGGYYTIRLNFPSDYPFNPPKAYFVTTDYRKSTRLHPNLYHSGKVCLSIFGTWDGPSWQPSLNLKAIGLTLISLLDENPLANEPGFELPLSNPKHTIYAQIIAFENIQVAVLDQLNNTLKDSNIREKALYQFHQMMWTKFLDNYDLLQAQITKLQELKLDGQTVNSPCFCIDTTYKLDKISKELSEMKVCIETAIKVEIETTLANEKIINDKAKANEEASWIQVDRKTKKH